MIYFHFRALGFSFLFQLLFCSVITLILEKVWNLLIFIIEKV